MTTGRNLRPQLTGRVIHPDSPAYTEARTDWDGLYRSYPLAVVFAETTEDVVNAITWARAVLDRPFSSIARLQPSAMTNAIGLLEAGPGADPA